MIIKNSIISGFLIFSLILLKTVLAASNIDSIYKYAWGDTIGWVNFGCDNCNLNVGDDKITGYAWSQNYGWINFSPSNGGVLNDSQGNLSGYAWGENLGWIDFSNVKINPSTGDFSGYAIILGGPGGKINFDCNNCKVKTSWRSTSITQPLQPSQPSASGSSRPLFRITTSTIEEIIKLALKLFQEKTERATMFPTFSIPLTFLTPQPTIVTPPSETFEITTETPSIIKQPIVISTTTPDFTFESKEIRQEQPKTKLPILSSYFWQILILGGAVFILLFVLHKIKK